MNYRLIKSCRICKSTKLHVYLDLGFVPLCNSLLESLSEKSATYPIQVMFCEECSLSQLSVVVDPEIMFKDYYYESSISNTFKKHCRDLAKSLSKLEHKNKPPMMIDIAANDGCLMEQFREEGFTVRGYDPCERLCKKAWEKLLLVIPKFFGRENLNEERSWAGEDIITATNVLAHVDDLHGFIEGVKYHFENNPKGIFIAEFPYFNNLLNNNQFDTIYHEHLSYFLLKPIVRLFKECGMPVFKVEEIDIHGGSLRIYASMHPYDTDYSVTEMLEKEESSKLHKLSTYQKFSQSVNKIKEELLITLELLYRNKSKVMGYGASAKGISLLNYCNIPHEFIYSIVDDTPEKQGKWTPGTYIPIVDFSDFEKSKPDHILLLAWNFEQELLNKTRFHRTRNGYYITPIPQVRVF